MAKISLTQNPKFKAGVAIPVKGDKDVTVSFEFKARTKAEMKAWFEGLKGSDKSITELVMECATGWELDDEFNLENLEKLEQNYQGSMQKIADAYIDEQAGARKGN